MSPRFKYAMFAAAGFALGIGAATVGLRQSGPAELAAADGPTITDVSGSYLTMSTLRGKSLRPWTLQIGDTHSRLTEPSDSGRDEIHVNMTVDGRRVMLVLKTPD